MFYSHQLLARKAPLGQIWMAATMHAKINRRKLDKLNIIKICEEILNPSIPMALRLSGILMGGVVIVYERKVKLLYEDVTRFMVEINEAWKVKTDPNPKVLPKGKSKAKKEAINPPENEENDEINVGDIEQSVQFSNTATTNGFQHAAYADLRLDNVDENYIYVGAREEDPSNRLHQADAENITITERFDSFQADEHPYNHFERFDIEGDEEIPVHATSGDYTEIPTTVISSPPHEGNPRRADIIEDQHPGQTVIPDEGLKASEEPRRRGPARRRRGQPGATTMDCEQTIIPVQTYQNWLQDASDTVSRQGRKRKRTDIMSSTKRANLMKLPPVVLIDDLFTSENKDVYYPAPILDLWIKSTQPPHHSPSERVSTHHPPEPSFSSPPRVHNEDFVGSSFEDFDSRQDNQSPAAPVEIPVSLMDELQANLSKVPAATPLVSSRNSGGSVPSLPKSLKSVSGHSSAPHPDLDQGRSKKPRYSSSGNSSGGLEPVAENANVQLDRVSEIPTPDLELIVETGPTQTQTQVNINHPSDELTESIQAQMKAHFNAPGAPQVESLHILSAGMNRKSAALLFYQTCVLASRDALRVEQKVAYGEILISRGSKL